MATPKTDNVTFASLNTEILQVAGTTQCSLSTAGARMGYTTNISMSNLRGCFGGSLTVGSAAATKFTPKYDGYDNGSVITGDSITDDVYTSGGRIDSAYEVNDTATSTMAFSDGAGGNPPAGYQGTDVNRLCYADTSRTLGSSTTTTADSTYAMPASGSVTFCVRFA